MSRVYAKHEIVKTSNCLSFSTLVITQRRSVESRALDVFSGVCLLVCLFVCQHDNFRTSKHRMMKLGARRIVQKSRPSSNLWVMAPGKCARLKNVAFDCDVANKISARCLIWNNELLWIGLEWKWRWHCCKVMKTRANFAESYVLLVSGRCPWPFGVDPQRKAEGIPLLPPFPSPPLRSRPLKSSYGVWGEL